MNGLKPGSVQIQWAGVNATRQGFRNRYTPDDELKTIALEALSSSEDGIYSKELIDKLKVYDRNDHKLIVGIVTEEIRRLFSKCFFDLEIGSWSNDGLTGAAFNTLSTCIEKMVKQSTSIDTKYLIRYKIKYLFDIHNLNMDTKEALRLIGFVEYFIDTFNRF